MAFEEQTALSTPAVAISPSTESHPNLAAAIREARSSHGAQFDIDLWRSCSPLKSPHPDDLARFWRAFRNAPYDRAHLANLLSASLPLSDEIAEDLLPDYLMLLELWLVGGQYEECTSHAGSLTIRFPADLRLQDIRARAAILAEDDSRLEHNLEYGYKPFADSFCSSTFDTLAFFEEDVFICCCNYIPSPVGSITATSTEALWDSATAQNIRGAILDGSYQYCNKMVCPRLRNRDLPKRDEPTLSDYYKDIIAKGTTSSPGCYPRSIELNEDPTCNLACPSCRSGPVGRDSEMLLSFEKQVLPGILDNELNSFLVACYGEPFASDHYLRILHGLDPAKNRIQELVIFTNGVLFTEAKWHELSNLHDYAIEVRISIDASNAATYSKLRPTLIGQGGWRALRENLAFMAELRAHGALAKLKLFFVVQRDNFREMPDFVRLAKRLGADEVVFSEMQKFGTFFMEDLLYASKAIHLEGHADFEEFQTVLDDPILLDPIVSLHGCRMDETPEPDASEHDISAALMTPTALASGPLAELDPGDLRITTDKPTRFAMADANARTIRDSVDVPADDAFHLVASLPLNKHRSKSNWFYVVQVTFQQEIEGHFGTKFKLEVKRDRDGKSIMSPMLTGQPIYVPFTYTNATLSDTVQSLETMIPPPAGDYTFELSAMSGGGRLKVIGTMTTISVLEIPQPS